MLLPRGGRPYMTAYFYDLLSSSHFSAGTRSAKRNVVTLRQQHRIGAVHGFGAVHHGALEGCRLHRNVFGEVSRQGDIALRVAGALAEIARGECFAREHATAERRSEQPQIGRGTGERL